jgi:hypothetical protein
MNGDDPNELTSFMSPTTPDEGPVRGRYLPRQRKRRQVSKEVRRQRKMRRRRRAT